MPDEALTPQGWQPLGRNRQRPPYERSASQRDLVPTWT